MTRQISVAESWKRTYEAFQDINFSAFDYYSVKSALIDYLKLHYAETFNDYVESSEQIAIIETFAYIAELLAYRYDMNAHEVLLPLAQRKQNVLQLAKFISYSASRNIPLRGLVKITQVATSQNVVDSRGVSLAGRTINWNDPNNANWKEQFVLVINCILQQSFGTVLPNDRVQVDDVVFESYSLKNNTLANNVIPFTAAVNGQSVPFELVPSTLNEYGPYEKRPSRTSRFSILYASDGVGDSSDNTGFFIYFKQGTLQRTTKIFDGITPNQTSIINVSNINQTDVWVNQIDPETGDILKDRAIDLLGRDHGYIGEWIPVDNTTTNNILYNNLPNRNKYEIETLDDDKVRIIFGDGEYAEIPNGTFDMWYRTSANDTLVLPKSQIINKKSTLGYTDDFGLAQSFTFSYSLVNSVANGSSSEDIESIRKIAPAVYFTQDRMVSASDYNNYMLQDPTILKLRAVNRTFAGDSKYMTWSDPSGTYENVQVFGRDLRLFFKESLTAIDVPNNTSISGTITNYMQPKLSYTSVKAYHAYHNLSNDRVVFSAQEIADITSVLYNAQPNKTPIKVAFIEDSTKAYQALVFTDSALGDANISNTMSSPPVNVDIGIFIDDNDEQIFNISVEETETLTTLATKINDVVSDLGASSFVDGSSIFIRSLITGNLSYISLNPTNVNTLKDNLQFFSHLSDLVVGTNISAWRAYNKTAALLTPHTFEITPSIFDQNNYVFWDVKFYEFALTCESDSTTFWNTNKDRVIVNGDTLTPLRDKLVILSANSNNNRDGLLPSDINLNVIGMDVQTDDETLGLNYLNRLLLETPDLNNDYQPDDIFLTDTLMNKSVIVNSSNNDDPFTIELVTPYISGFGEVKVFNQSTELIRGVDYTEYTELDFVNEATVGDTVYGLKFESEFANIDLTVVYYDFIYYQEDSNGIYKYVETTTTVKQAWYYNNSTPTVRYAGRADLNFMWIYNTPYLNLINPAPTNVHDMFIITRGYYQQLQLWLSGASEQPTPPTPYELRNTYGTWLQNKMRSDHVVLHPGKIKLLFGKKAIPQLQSKIKVVKDPNSKLTDNEIKVKIVSIVKDFFDINYWEFGEMFSFSELAAVIHGRLTNDVKTVVLVPTLSTSQFGDMYEIYASDEEILQPDITVDDIVMVASLNSNVLRQ